MIVDVDGLPVEVDDEEYTRAPAVVEERVRAARAALVGDLSGIHEEAPDYDLLVAVFGEDGDPDAGE